MSSFALLSADVSLLEPATKAKWGSHNFCPVVKSFQVQAITQAQLNILSQVGAWGDVGKPQQDVAFLLIGPSIAMGNEKVFGLVAIWAHPCQACYHSLEEVAQKHALLLDEIVDWAYPFVQLNDDLSHLPLLSEGYTSTMTDGTPSADTYG